MFSGAGLLTIALALQSHAAHAPARAAADQPFQRLFQNFTSDVRALPSRDTAIVLGTGAIAASAAHSSDAGVAGWASAAGDSSYSDAGDVYGDGWTQGTLAVGTYVIGVVGHNGEVTSLGSDLIRAQLLNGALTEVVKVAADRRRPSGGSYSFPSGHSSAAFATAGVLERHFGWKAAVPAYGAATFVAWSRVRDNAHWLSDVIVGGAIGTVVGRTVGASGHQSNWTVAPSATAHSVGVFVSRN